VKDLGLTAIHVTHDQAEAMSISDRIAVMRRGRVLQVGTPMELYMHPKHIFVAHFLGEANFLEGYAEKVGDKSVVVHLRGGLTVRVDGWSAEEGERVVLSVRPEVLGLRVGVHRGENALVGRIERVMFEGVTIRYEVRLENEDLVVVTKPTMLGEFHKEGEEVTVDFPPGRAIIFPYPKRGLREELSLE